MTPKSVSHSCAFRPAVSLNQALRVWMLDMVHNFWTFSDFDQKTIRENGDEVKIKFNTNGRLDRSCLDMSLTLRAFDNPLKVSFIRLPKYRRETRAR